MSDVLLFQTIDGGEIDVLNGQVSVDQGLATSVYLSLFGGNEDDGNIEADDSLQWWGNFIEDDPDAVMRGEFQKLSEGLPAITSNLILLQEAAERDLAWLTSGEVADSVTVTVSIPRLNWLRLEIEISVNQITYPFTFEKAWSS